MHEETQAPSAETEDAVEKFDDETLVLHPEFSDLRFLARGGLGAVYVATDRQFHRDIAIKFIHGRLTGDSEACERFLLESEVTARLEHPGVVPVHGAGQTGAGRHFYAMRLIQGETLEAAINRFHASERERTGGARPMEFQDLLTHFVAVCKTIAYAHNRGVIHRDIKPENIMLGRYGETLVVDWGLALPVGREARFKDSGEKTLLPGTGSSSSSSAAGAGTPVYMSPEQFRGDTAIGPATDIYSLGVTLYKIMTGDLPFRADNFQALRWKVCTGELSKPATTHGVSPALEAIARKAMAVDAAQRYATALDLARDVERFLADEAVTAYQEARVQKWGRWARRHRFATQAIAVATVAVLALALVSAIGLGGLAGREREARLAADAARSEGLAVSAKFAARTVASDIDVRWRILEAEATDGELRTHLAGIVESPDDASLWPPLQAWLDARFIEHGATVKSDSWFIMARQGVQIARSPASDTIGQSFAYRDYFHGQGRDLARDVRDVVPIQGVHLSTVLRSTATGKLKVAFSVPIWSGRVGAPNRTVLGVLSMSVNVGEFGVLEGLSGGQLAVLVDTREDDIDGEFRRGLILHHGSLAQHDESQGAARLAPALLEQIIRAAPAPDGTSAGHSSLPLLQDYRDPVLKEPISWIAMVEPVVVAGRPDEAANTGWVIIAQQRADAESKPSPD